MPSVFLWAPTAKLQEFKFFNLGSVPSAQGLAKKVKVGERATVKKQRTWPFGRAVGTDNSIQNKVIFFESCGNIPHVGLLLKIVSSVMKNETHTGGHQSLVLTCMLVFRDLFQRVVNSEVWVGNSGNMTSMLQFGLP